MAALDILLSASKQWGLDRQTAQNKTISFPLAFSTVYAIIGNNILYNSDTDWAAKIPSYSVTNFNYVAYYNAPTAWMALGS